jgi:hypothetical protein
MPSLPQFFLADLSPEASLQPAMMRDACQALKLNRQRYLAGRSTDQLVRLIAELGQLWRQSDFPLRRMALDACPVKTGFTRGTLQRGIDDFFAPVNEVNLRALLAQELGHEQRLDELVASPIELNQDRTAIAQGPELLVHITAGNLPCPAWTSMLLGLLLKSAQFVKCASNASFLPLLLAHSIHELEPKLGACLEIAIWPGGSHILEDVLFSEADCVTATGSNETLAAIRSRLPTPKRFLGYGHRTSFGYVTKRALAKEGSARLALALAQDVTAWDQLGCLSPHVCYVETDGGSVVEEFAQKTADSLAELEQSQPRGPLPVQAAAAIATRRAFYQVRAAHSSDTQCWFSPNSTAWSVVCEADPRFQPSCGYRFVYVKSVTHLETALQAADTIRNEVATVGLAATQSEKNDVAIQLARWGVARVCPLGKMQNPPLAWRHDGRPALADLVSWTDYEL